MSSINETKNNSRIKTTEVIYVLLLLLFGVATFIMSFFVPMAGGGASLMIVLTSPILFGLSIIFSFLHFWAFKKSQPREILFVLFVSFSILLLLPAFVLYPYR